MYMMRPKWRNKKHVPSCEGDNPPFGAGEAREQPVVFTQIIDKIDVTRIRANGQGDLTLASARVSFGEKVEAVRLIR
jgi:hypothetical protein